MKSVRNKILKISSSVVVSGVLLYFLTKTLNKFSWEGVINSVSFRVVLVSFLFYLLIKIINTIRYNFVFKTKGFFKTMILLFYSNFVLSLVPFRIGEISYVSLFKQNYDIEYKYGVGNLITIRLFDYLSICLFSIVSFLLVVRSGNLIINDRAFAYPLYLSLLISVLFIIFILFIKRSSIFLEKIKKYVDFNQISKRKLSSVALLSIFYWFLRFNLGIYLFYSVGVDIGYFEMFFISTLMMILSLIPIQTFASFGVFEGGWVGALILFGVSKNDILNKVIAVHFLSLLNVIVFGVISWVILHTLIQNTARRTYLGENTLENS